jgi:hypothetical protein
VTGSADSSLVVLDVERMKAMKHSKEKETDESPKIKTIYTNANV